jgi:transcriptional regulator with XRE-family HTH domain
VYARYEQGKSMPSVEKLDELLSAIAPDQRIVWRLAA